MQKIKLTPEELYDYLSNVDHSYSSVHEFLCEAIKLRNQDLVDRNLNNMKNPWDLAWSKWWVQQNYKKCEVDDMTLSEINELLEQD